MLSSATPWGSDEYSEVTEEDSEENEEINRSHIPFEDNKNAAVLAPMTQKNETYYRRSVQLVNKRYQTTLLYFNPDGSSFKFTYYGNRLPAPSNRMLKWLEEKKNTYNLVQIKYEPPKPLPTTKDGRYLTECKSDPPQLKKGIKWDDVLPNICGEAEVNLDKVGNGRDAKIEENPWQVMIVNTEGEARCGGSIISKWHVLTAAHCFTAKEPTAGDDYKETHIDRKERLVFAGISSANDIDQSCYYKIKEYYTHNSFTSRNHRDDIAIVVIAGSFSWNIKVSPICLPNSNEKYEPDQRARISGYGDIGYEKTNYGNVLQSGDVKISTKEYCEKENKKYFKLKITRGMFCANGVLENGHHVDTCKGDSGGPLVSIPTAEKNVSYLLGVTSFGNKCSLENFPGIYTKVALYLDWIHPRLEVSMDPSKHWMYDLPKIEKSNDYVEDDNSDQSQAEDYADDYTD